MNPDVPAACLPALIRASSAGTSFPLVRQGEDYAEDGDIE